MNAVELFATLLAQRSNVRKSEYSALPAYDHLIKAGLIEDAGVVSSTICGECDHPHDAKIVFENEGYGYYCPAFGFIPTPRSDLIATRPNISAFVTQIADDLNCKKRKSTPVHGDTWRVGIVSTHADDVAVYFKPVLQDADDLHNLTSALAMEVKGRFGVVLTAIGSLGVSAYKTASFVDCLSFDPNHRQLQFDADIAAIAGIPRKPTGGRSKEFQHNLAKLITARQKSGRVLVGQNEEVRAITAEFVQKHPTEKIPSPSTIKRYLP